MDKYGIRVIEKLFELGNKKQNKNIVNEIIMMDKKNNNTIKNLASNKFGNYIFKYMLNHGDEKSKNFIRNKIFSFPEEGYCKYVYDEIRKSNNNI